MSHPGSPVWVIAEQVGGEIPQVCFELTGQARILADELRVYVEVVLLGYGLGDQVGLLSPTPVPPTTERYRSPASACGNAPWMFV